MEAEVLRYMRLHGMPMPPAAIWVAVSGGADSMVLLQVLKRLGFVCRAAHADHGLRGAESEADRAFVVDQCGRMGIGVETTTLDVVAHVKAGNFSVEMAARELRYAWFRTLLAGGPGHMALGHHADDAVETLLLNLMRGPGFKGWDGIAPVAGPFFRPLMAVDRSGVRAYAAEHGVPFREDSSNTDPAFLRNRVRHELIPLMEQLRAGSTKVMARSLPDLAELVALGEAEVEAELQHLPVIASDGVVVSKDRILRSRVPRALLLRLLAPHGFHPSVIDQLHLALLEGSVGARFYGTAYRITVERDTLVLECQPAAPAPMGSIAADLSTDAPLGLSMRYCNPQDEGALRTPTVARLDADNVQFPLLVRPWQPGDRMRPMGLGGSKLISDILTDAKVPNTERARQRVVVSGNEIVWLVGHRVAEGHGTRESTQRVLELSVV